MSKIEELIQQLCPNGVEWKEIGEICKIQRGVRVVRNDLSTEGQYPVYQNSLIPLGYYTNTNYPKNTTYIIGAGAAADIGFSEIPYWGADDCYSVLCSKTILNKFVYYYLKNNQLYLKTRVRKASIPRLARNVIEKMIIPLPPLPVQEEIVRILDAFTSHAAELQAELQARREQYEYYRNKLLSFEDNSSVEWKKLGEIGSVCMCKRIMKNQTNSTYGIPFYKIGTFGKTADSYISPDLYEDYKNRFSFPRKGEILISASGTIGRSVIYDGEDAYFQDSNIVWLQNDETIVLNKYLYYCYQIIDWNVEGGTIKRLYNNSIVNTEIPVPSLDEQRRIVAILDKFEALVNDLTEGLPAEIAARQEQYEYYRNMLLSFPKAV